VYVPKKPSCSRVKTSFLLAIDRAGIVRHESIGKFQLCVVRSVPGNFAEKECHHGQRSFHRSNIVKDVAMRKHLTLNFIPPYSPWHNPVEYAFSSIKALDIESQTCSRQRGVSLPRAFESVDSSMTSKPDHAQRLYRQDLHVYSVKMRRRPYGRGGGGRCP
jgi:transposase